MWRINCWNVEQRTGKFWCRNCHFNPKTLTANQKDTTPGLASDAFQVAGSILTIQAGVLPCI